MKIYTQFVNNFSNAMDTLEEEKKKNKFFGAYIQVCLFSFPLSLKRTNERNMISESFLFVDPRIALNVWNVCSNKTKTIAWSLKPSSPFP